MGPHLIDFLTIDRQFSVGTCDDVGAVVDGGRLVLVVVVDTEKLEVNALLFKAVRDFITFLRFTYIIIPSFYIIILSSKK